MQSLKQQMPVLGPRCVFVHVPKAAGTSVTRGLEDALGVRATVTGRTSSHHYRQHYTLRTLSDKGLVPAGALAFALVREPVARCLSDYRWARGINAQAACCRSFDAWLEATRRTHAQRHQHTRDQLDYVETEDGSLDHDRVHVGRHEHLALTWRHVTHRLGVAAAELPHENRSAPDPVHITQEHVRSLLRLYQRDYRAFGYVAPLSPPAPAGGPVVFTTFNIGYAKMFRLWYRQFRTHCPWAELRVGTYGRDALDYATKITAQDAHATPVLLCAEDVPGRGDIWRLRTEHILGMVQTGRDVIHSDADAMWLGDAAAFMGQSYQDVDMACSMNVGGVPRSARRRWGFNLCCGLFQVRGTAGGAALLQRVLEMMRGGAQGDDQVAFNSLPIEWDPATHTSTGKLGVCQLPGGDVAVAALTDWVVCRNRDDKFVKLPADRRAAVLVVHPCLLLIDGMPARVQELQRLIALAGK